MPSIAVVRSTYSPYGGVEKVTLTIVRELLDMGVKVTLLTLPGQHWPVVHPNLQMVTAGIRWGNRLWQAWIFNHFVNKYLSTHSFDCIFAFERVSQFTHFHAGGGTHKTFLKIKNENSSVIEALFRKISLFHAYTLYLEKKGFSNPGLKKIQCCSKMVLNDIQADYRLNADKLQVIYNGIEWDEIGETFRNRFIIADEIRKKHQISPDWNCLLFLGSGFSRKGLDIAIEGLAALPDCYHLLVIGKNSCRAYFRQALKSGIAHRVHFLGSREKGWRYASVCKALVLPSYYEPFGLAPAEAHAMGIPVLVSDKTGYAEWILTGKNGVILQYPMTGDRIGKSFSELARIIEHPEMTADEIRNHVSELDNKIIYKKLIRDFLIL